MKSSVPCPCQSEPFEGRSQLCTLTCKLRVLRHVAQLTVGFSVFTSRAPGCTEGLDTVGAVLFQSLWDAFDFPLMFQILLRYVANAVVSGDFSFS